MFRYASTDKGREDDMDQNARTLTKNVENRRVAWPPAARRKITQHVVRMLRRTIGRIVGRLAAVSFAALLTVSMPVTHAPQAKASEAAKAPRLLDIADSPPPSAGPVRRYHALHRTCRLRGDTLRTNAVCSARERRRFAGFPRDRLHVASPGCDHIHDVALAPLPMQVDLLAHTRGHVLVATRQDACVALREMPA